MRKILILCLIFFCLCILGCSVPSAARYSQLFSFTREEKKIKGAIGRRKAVLVRDFRENARYEEDMAGLQEEIEEYILAHPDLNEQTQLNLRKLRLSQGATKEQVLLLLGKPDKILATGGRANYDASAIWIYKINKIRAFTVFIIPVFLVHEGYYLYFKDNVLVGIERHYLKQIVQQGSAPGLPTSRKK